MASLIYDTATGAPVSVGSVVADPLPSGLTAVVLTGPQHDGLRDGSLRWDPASKTVVVDTARAAELAAEAAAVSERAALPGDIPLLVAERDDSNLARDQMTVASPSFLAKWTALPQGPTAPILRTGTTEVQLARIFDAIDTANARLDNLAKLANNLVDDQRKQHSTISRVAAVLLRKLRADRNDTA